MKKLLLTLLFCFFSFSANAKVTLLNIPLKQLQIDVIKGHLYTASQYETESKKNKILYAKAVQWVEKLHKSKKIFEISNIKREERNIIQASVYFLAKVERGEYIPKLSKKNLEIWHAMGQKVFVFHKGKVWRLDIK